jgi:hypothetical protein
MIAWSPNLTNSDFPKNYDDWPLDDKIKLFEAQILGWQLNIADEIINNPKDKHPHAGFAVLSILLNYFEMLGGYLDGIERDTTRKHFKIGLIHVFPVLKDRKDIIDILYKEARCGMYHVGITGKNIILTRNFDTPIATISDNTGLHIAIDPHSLTKELIQHFKQYVVMLRSLIDLPMVQNFEKRFNYLKREKVNIQNKL